ncbi:MAG: superfamily C-terminal [Parcubacteria group bacterium]|nr:superfamily C-terminal [Parcubacteria group bacterium]
MTALLEPATPNSLPKVSHHSVWKQRDFQRRFLLSLSLFALSCVVNFYAGTYATREASSSVTDIILSNTRVYDVDILFVYGALLLVIFIAGLCFARPRRFPFVLFSLSVFIFTRSIFISLTHIGPFPEHVALDLGTIASKFMFGGDLFFSGHTGIPFLMALLFWRERAISSIFFIWSLFFGTIVLLGHLHYSIDVLSAFFITYTIYHMASYFFPLEKQMFENTFETK